MRIIAGTAKGRRLFAPDGAQTRPTSDRVRESIFNILRGEIEDARVLDLFAGSGAMGLEAISRGAASVVFNDSSRAAIAVLRRNVDLMGVADRCRIVNRDYLAALATLREERFTLVFLDPPYRMEDAYGKAVAALNAQGLLSRDALIVMERDAARPAILPEGFSCCDSRTYRDTAIDFVRRNSADDSGISGQL